ncbi:helix-turn-helix domain-containing protein [Acrocarpospora sp. B8E8]|uniref:winged helix-turn-helix transcriptional regulator n=1 Tax=Acrocarpospora sp. B8E8 TaxID=3153572 RepID=UPI00325F91D1
MLEYDERTCLVRQILDRVGDKWTLNVIHHLADGQKRFMELQREIPGISQRMLTVTLRGLEEDGLVERTIHPVVPPRVDYELTPLGRTLLDTVCQLMDWTLAHLDDIEAARAAYAARENSLKRLSEHADPGPAQAPEISRRGPRSARA